MDDLLKALAKLLRLKNLVILALTGAVNYLALTGMTTAAIITGAFSTLLPSILNSKD